jgi:hypothetical protein
VDLNLEDELLTVELAQLPHPVKGHPRFQFTDEVVLFDLVFGFVVAVSVGSVVGGEDEGGVVDEECRAEGKEEGVGENGLVR